MKHFLKLLSITFLTLSSVFAYSQTDTIRFKMVQTLTKYIKSNYVSGGIANQMCDSINWKFFNNKYDTSLNLDEFAYEITKDLRRISKDEHISVTRPLYKTLDADAYSYEFNKMTEKQRKKYFEKSQKDWEKFKKEYKERTKDDMFTYGEIKILPGNIGYAEINDFGSTSYDKKQNKGRISIETVMHFFRNTNSIIIDFRDNQGGFIKQAAKFCSYFSPTTSNYFLTTEWHFRYDSSGIEIEISDNDKILTSDRNFNLLTKSKNIYILTSQRTFSAAELSTYKIKQFNPNATIIGEKTKGGGNGHSGGTTEKYFSAIIPYLKSFDENNSNYSIEAKGISPDIKTCADSALVVAYRLASKETTPTNNKVKYYKKQHEPVIENIQFFKKYFKDYLGDYRKIKIVNEDENLFMIYDTYDIIQLFPEAVDYFTGNRIQFVKFIRNTAGQVSEVQVRHNAEFSEQFKRR